MENKKFITTAIISILGLMGLGVFLSLQAPTVFDELETAINQNKINLAEAIAHKIINNAKNKQSCFVGFRQFDHETTKENWEALKIYCEQK